MSFYTKYYTVLLSLFCLVIASLVLYDAIDRSSIGWKEYPVKYGNVDSLQRAYVVSIALIDTRSEFKFRQKNVGWVQHLPYFHRAPPKQIGENTWITYNGVGGSIQIKHYNK